ncbi:hypothetical protein Peur_073835 [Populus x canadensis]
MSLVGFTDSLLTFTPPSLPSLSISLHSLVFPSAFARIENHCFVNKMFFSSDSSLLENVDKKRHINTTIAQV